MRPEERDPAYLWDMREFASAARSMAEGLSREELRSDLRSQFALAKAIELVGENASRVSQTFRDAHPEIPWSEIVGVRHRLVHDGRCIDINRVWDVIHLDLPPLIAALDALVPEPPEEG